MCNSFLCDVKCDTSRECLDYKIAEPCCGERSSLRSKQMFDGLTLGDKMDYVTADLISYWQMS